NRPWRIARSREPIPRPPPTASSPSQGSRSRRAAAASSRRSAAAAWAPSCGPSIRPSAGNWRARARSPPPTSAPTRPRASRAPAALTARRQPPGVPPVHEQGTLDDGRPYFTMKLIEGNTLDALLKQRSGPLDDLPRFVTVFSQVCQTVAYAHSHGVVHRDL